MTYKSYLPHTYENQTVLREYGEKISGSFQKNRAQNSPSLWSRICSIFPTSTSISYTVGEHLALTYGAQWSNSTIDFVVRQFFKHEAKPTSFWSWNGLKYYFFGATKATLAETLKLTITPKILPYITLLTGSASAVAIPTVISLVSCAYQRVIFDPRKLEQLSHLKLDQFFTIDSETGRLRDAFGRLMSVEDMRDILTGTAKYDLICKLIELCHQVDQLDKDDDALQTETLELLENFANSYIIEREDGKMMFPDGTLFTADEQEIIRAGTTVLSRINPRHKTNKIRCFIRLLAKHSFTPLETLSYNDKKELSATDAFLTPKRMPPLFPEGKQEWKNAIIRCSDGKYILSQEIGGKKKGTLVSNDKMTVIFKELKSHQAQKKAEQKKIFLGLLYQPKQHKVLVEKLNQLNRGEIQAFFKSYIIERKVDKQAVFCNGDLLDAKDWQKFQQDLALLPTKQDTLRANKIKSLVDRLAVHIPKNSDSIDSTIIYCNDKCYITRKGEMLSSLDAKKQMEELKLSKEEKEFVVI
jgi:hypothetical protein